MPYEAILCNIGSSTVIEKKKKLYLVTQSFSLKSGLLKNRVSSLIKKILKNVMF